MGLIKTIYLQTLLALTTNKIVFYIYDDLALNSHLFFPILI